MKFTAVPAALEDSEHEAYVTQMNSTKDMRAKLGKNPPKIDDG